MYGSRKILTHDHERLDELLAEHAAARSTDPEAAHWRWLAFSQALRRHAEMEEAVLFPAYAANVHPAPGGPFDAIRAQHVEIRARLDALDRGDLPEDERRAREGELMDLMWAHEAQEETLFLPWMLSCLSEAERALLHERMDVAQSPGSSKVTNG